MSIKVLDGRPLVALTTPEEVTLHFGVASLGSRVIALSLDLVVLFALLVAVMMPVTMLASIDEGVATALAYFVHFVLRNFYFIASELRWQGRTVGKRAARLRVIARDGGPLTAGMIFARNLTRDVEIFLPIQLLLTDTWLAGLDSLTSRLLTTLWLLLVVLLPMFNRHRARLGDLVAGTLVVGAPETVLLEDLATESAESPDVAGYQFTQAQLDVYGIRELQVLEDVLRRSPGERDARLLRVIARKVKHKIGWAAEGTAAEGTAAEGTAAEGTDPEDDERFLRAFYAAQRGRLEAEMLFGRRREGKVR